MIAIVQSYWPLSHSDFRNPNLSVPLAVASDTIAISKAKTICQVWPTVGALLSSTFYLKSKRGPVYSLGGSHSSKTWPRKFIELGNEGLFAQAFGKLSLNCFDSVPSESSLLRVMASPINSELQMERSVRLSGHCSISFNCYPFFRMLCLIHRLLRFFFFSFFRDSQNYTSPREKPPLGTILL